MKERVFNLFYFVRNGLIEELGGATHEIEGTDEEKANFLRSAVSGDHKTCRRFPLPNHEKLTIDSLNALSRVGTVLQLFEGFFTDIGACENPLYCLTGIADGKPMDDRTIYSKPGFLFRKQLDPKEGVEILMADYLEDYLTPNGLDLPALFNDDYFNAIRLCFNHGHYVSSMKLIASFIDTVAFLEFGDTRNNFTRWLQTYADLRPLGVSPSQLWEFRNSLLHMSNLDSRKVLAGQERRISFCVAQSGTVSPPDDEVQYFNLIDLIEVLAEAMSKWFHSFNANRDKFPIFVERYDRVVSDARGAKVLKR